MSIRNRRSISNKIPVSRKSALLRHPFPNEPTQLFLEDAESVHLQHFQHSPNWEYCCKCRENCPEVSSHECSSLSMTNSTVRETSSTSSWTDDECEQSATRNVRCMLDELEEILYDSTETCDTNESLVAESLHWKKHFPHFRIVGKKMAISSENLLDEFSCVPSTSFIHDITDSDYTDTIPDLCLKVQGVALNSVPPVEENTLSDSNHILREEIIVQDGIYEELFAVDNSDDLDSISIATNPKEISEQQVDKTTCASEFEEKILNILIGRIWNQVVSRIEAFFIHKDHYKSEILAVDHTEEYTPIRIKREISSAAVSHFYPPTQVNSIPMSNAKITL